VVHNQVKCFFEAKDLHRAVEAKDLHRAVVFNLFCTATHYSNPL